MTRPAVFTGIEFLAYKSLVNIRMAIIAFKTNIPERPFSLFFVTFKTWFCCMSPHEREVTFIVLPDRIGKLFKTFYIMACGAIGGYNIMCHLSLMIVCMAISAIVMFHRISELRFVACPAVNQKMLFDKREACFAVVKCVDPLDHLK